MSASRSRLVRRILAGLASVAALSGTAAVAETPPPQPGLNQLGGEGPCTQGTRREGYGSKANYNWLYVPAGSGTPRTGGTCSDAHRPVIFFSPGFVLAPITPEYYNDLIANMVSNGYIVAFANAGIADGENGYPQIITGFDYAATTLNARAGNRMDLTNVGLWGHSYGAGAIPWLAQQFQTRGWGSASFWAAINASSFVYNEGRADTVSPPPPITLPTNIRLQFVAYDDDDTVDQDAAVDVFKSVNTPADRKTFIHLKSDGSYMAVHQLPTRNGDKANYLNYYGVFRNYQALADCTRFGTNCAVDLTKMGNFSNPAREAVNAVIQTDPKDTANKPATLVKCGDNTSSGKAARDCRQP